MSSIDAGETGSLNQMFDAFRAPLHRLEEIANAFKDCFHRLALNSTSEFLPTPITALPIGNETGRFLALDIGGSNFRVGFVELLGDNTTYLADERFREGSVDGRLKVSCLQNFEIPEYLKISDAESLFVWVARKIAELVQNNRDLVEIGITFSFPMEQSTHTSALILSMGKGFTFRATNNLSTLLLDAYNSLLEGGVFKDLPPLRVVSITNDSIATLLSAAYIHHNAQSLTAAGIILGTGTNATCFCPISKLAKAKISNKAATKILINTEWSINGTLPVLVSSQTTWDKVLDAANEKPGYQPFEEMVSGRYLGEIVRLAAISTVFATEDEKTFPPKLRQPYSIETKLCSEIEAASCIEDACGLLYANYGSVHFWTPQRVLVLRELVIAVSNRAAALLAAATVGILALNEEFDVVAKDGQQQTVVVGYTGTVLVKYSTFSERCQRFLDRLAGDGRVQLVEARDGGIIGAAVLAGMVASGIT